MEETYGAYWSAEKRGVVALRRDGLYLDISCQCTLPEDMMFELYIQTEQKSFSLGLLVPEEAGFVLRKKIPVKSVGDGVPRFCLRPRHAHNGERFIPVRAEEPFSYLSLLSQCKMARRDGRTGILLPEEKI